MDTEDCRRWTQRTAEDGHRGLQKMDTEESPAKSAHISEPVPTFFAAEGACEKERRWGRARLGVGREERMGGDLCNRSSQVI